jgi:hypothetical protein
MTQNIHEMSLSYSAKTFEIFDKYSIYHLHNLIRISFKKEKLSKRRELLTEKMKAEQKEQEQIRDEEQKILK